MANLVKDMIHKVDADGNGANDALASSSPMAVKVKRTDTEEELVEAFKVFDRGTKGLIIAAGLRHLMTHMSEKLTDEESDEMVSEGGSCTRCRCQSSISC